MSNEIGVLVDLNSEHPELAQVHDLGLRVCQLVGWKPELWTPAVADRVREEARRLELRINAFWAGWMGPAKWNFTEGPSTIGLVPPAYRAQRVENFKRAGDFAQRLGVPAMITHLGFLPEHAGDPLFDQVAASVREVAKHLEQLGLEFWFETGEETPICLLRFMQKVGASNLGVNLDPANLILYGNGNPIDALDVLGGKVRSVHAKDGLYPTDPMRLGEEVKVGQGRVRFPEFVRRLREIGYQGDFIIEREISGEQQRLDIAETVNYLKKLLSTLG